MIRSPRRVALAGLGIVCVGLAGVGVVVPGMPTTIFLIAASYLFTRSCPWLEEKLVRSRPFGPYLRYLDGDQPMPRRARVSALLMMWTAVATSLVWLWAGALLSPTGAAVIIASACCGTAMIVLYRRERAS
jgi:hypothetical protein